MSADPDSEAENYKSVRVSDTTEHDNPKFGAVTVHLNRERMSQAIRMTRYDAEYLANELIKYLNQKEA